MKIQQHEEKLSNRDKVILEDYYRGKEIRRRSKEAGIRSGEVRLEKSKIKFNPYLNLCLKISRDNAFQYSARGLAKIAIEKMLKGKQDAVSVNPNTLSKKIRLDKKIRPLLITR